MDLVPCRKKSANPCTVEYFPFPLLKDVEHTPDMQHHLTKICIEFTNKLNPQQVAAVDCSDQPIYALAKLSNRNTGNFRFQRALLYIKNEFFKQLVYKMLLLI